MNESMAGRSPRGRVGLVALIGVALSLFFVVAPAPAGAQTVSTIDQCDILFGDVDALDFIDPVTGELDDTGYLLILSASTATVSVVNNGSLTVCVAGLMVGTQLTITLDGTTVLFDGPFDPNSTINGVAWNADLMAIALNLPNLACGPHQITAVGTTADGEPFSQSYSFEVTGCDPGALPVTGSDTGKLVGIGAALVVLGAGVYYGARQRRGLVA